MTRKLQFLLTALLLMVGVTSAWADDPVNWLSGATVTVNYASDDKATTLTVTDGTVTFTPATDKTEIRLTVEKDQTINNGQIFVLIEGTNIKKDDAKLAMVSIDGSTTDSDSKPYGYTNAHAIPYAPSSQLTTNPVVIMAPLSRAASGDNPNGSILLNKFTTSESMTVNKIQVIVKLVETNKETSIKRVGMYTLGEITQLYSEFKKIKWQYKENNLLGLQDGNSSTYSDNQKTISLVSGKTISMDVAKILFKSMYGLTSNYTEIDVRNLALSNTPTPFTEDLLSNNTSSKYLFAANDMYKNFPTMRGKAVNIASCWYYQYKDGIEPTEGKILQKHNSNHNADYYSYTRNFESNKYYSCVLPFDVTTAELPIGLSAYTFGSCSTEGVVTFISAGTTIPAGTPFVVKSTVTGLYQIYPATTPNVITTLENYYESSPSNNVCFVGSFVSEKPMESGKTYASGYNCYGINSDGDKFIKMSATTKTTYFRAFLASSNSTFSRALSLSFDNGDGTTEIVSLKDVNGMETVGDGAIYNLQGVRMNGDNLPRGIYVKNGKKFVVK